MAQPPRIQTQGNPVDPPADPPPKIIDNQHRPDGTVAVTWALPGLRRATLTVPERRWQVGGHSVLGKPLAAFLTALAPDNQP